MRKAAVTGLAIFMAAALPARAHHAFATEFDVNRPVELKGKVTKIELINPHSWITLEVIGKDGKPETWMVEGGSPNALVRKGVTKASVPVGSELTVRGYGTRDGTNKAVGRDIMFADGRPLFFEGSKPASNGSAPSP
jgi:hypothetical protein